MKALQTDLTKWAKKSNLFFCFLIRTLRADSQMKVIRGKIRARCKTKYRIAHEPPFERMNQAKEVFAIMTYYVTL